MSKLEVREIGPISGETEVRLADGATAVGFGDGNNMPSFRVLGGYPNTPNGTYVKMKLEYGGVPDPTRWDVGDNFDNNNNRFIAPEEGYYSFSYVVTYNTKNPSDRVFAQIRVNDNANNSWQVNQRATGGAQRINALNTAVVYLQENDYVELFGMQETGDPADARSGETLMSGFKLAGLS